MGHCRDRAMFSRAALIGSGKRYQPVCLSYEIGRQCPRGDKCPLRHEMPKKPISHRRYVLDKDHPVRLAELVEKASKLGVINPPEDQSIKTFYIRLLNSSVLEHDIRDRFCSYGEIESIRFFARREVTCAFLTYATRQSAEKAMLELSSQVDIKGQRLLLSWAPDEDICNRALARCALLTQQRNDAIISTQEFGAGLINDAPQQQKMDPQSNAVISTQGLGGSSSSENHGASSSYQMPPHPPPHQEECEHKRRKLVNFRAGLINDGPQQQRMDPQRNNAVILTQGLGGSSSNENHGASSSYQMPPHPPPHREECEDKRRKLVNFRALLMGSGQRYQPVCLSYETGRQCPRGDKCPLRHEMPKKPISHRRYVLDKDDPVRLAELVEKASKLGVINPPEDQSIKTFYIRLLNSSVLEHDIRDRFCTYGEIESIRFFARREVTCAFLTYATRQSAEKAMLELSSQVDINGQRLLLSWAPDEDSCNRALARCALLTQQQRMNPQRNDAVISTQEVGGSSSSENHGASSS